MVKRKLTILLATIMLLTGALTYGVVKQYKYLEFLTYDYSQLNWLVDPGTYEAIWSMGFGDKFCYCIDKNDNYGILDAQGNVIVPCEYGEVLYQGGNYMAAADETGWTLFDTKGNKAAHIDTIKLNYAGDKYFIEYENLNKMGFKIIDGIEGKVVKEYPDYYNAMKLDDGNWYVIKNYNENARRWVGANDTYYDDGDTIEYYDYYTEQKKYEPAGFFTDENFNKLFDGKEYYPLLTGNGHYIVDEIQNNKIVKRAVLNDTGELYTIEKRDKINKYIEDKIQCSDENDTIFLDKSGNIGLPVTSNYNWLEKYILYFDKENNEIIKTKVIHGNVIKTLEVGSLRMLMDPIYIAGLKDENGKVILEPVFYEINVLSGGKTAAVSTEDFEAIVSLERGDTYVSEND